MQIVPRRTFFVCVASAGEHGDRFQTRLVNQAVAEPNRFEHARLFGDRGRIRSTRRSSARPNSAPRLGRLKPHFIGRFRIAISQSHS